jgi:hypothetical protein
MVWHSRYGVVPMRQERPRPAGPMGCGVERGGVTDRRSDTLEKFFSGENIQ